MEPPANWFSNQRLYKASKPLDYSWIKFEPKSSLNQFFRVLRLASFFGVRKRVFVFLFSLEYFWLKTVLEVEKLDFSGFVKMIFGGVAKVRKRYFPIPTATCFPL